MKRAWSVLLGVFLLSIVFVVGSLEKKAKQKDALESSQEIYSRPLRSGEYVVYRGGTDVRSLWAYRDGENRWLAPVEIKADSYQFCWHFQPTKDGELRLFVVRSEREFPTSALMGDEIGVVFVCSDGKVRRVLAPFMKR